MENQRFEGGEITLNGKNLSSQETKQTLGDCLGGFLKFLMSSDPYEDEEAEDAREEAGFDLLEMWRLGNLSVAVRREVAESQNTPVTVLEVLQIADENSGVRKVAGANLAKRRQ